MEAYLSGQMTPQEHDAFKARIGTDPALQEARLLITGVREAILMEKMNSFHDSATKRIPSIAPEKKTRTWWMAAAVAAIVIATSAVFLFKNSGEDKLVAAYFEADPGLATAMSSGEDYAFNRGMVDYKMGKYQEAIDVWRPLEAAAPANDTLHYFSGVSFLALKKTDSAVRHLRLAWDNSGSSFRSDAGWYLALALLDQGKKDEARTLLQQTNHPKKDELLSRIK